MYVTFEIKKVIFNGPATIVFWADGTKTVVKFQCYEDEFYDAEKAIAMAIAKKAMGNTGRYFSVIRKWVEEGIDQDESLETCSDLFDLLDLLGNKKELK